MKRISCGGGVSPLKTPHSRGKRIIPPTRSRAYAMIAGLSLATVCSTSFFIQAHAETLHTFQPASQSAPVPTTSSDRLRGAVEPQAAGTIKILRAGIQQESAYTSLESALEAAQDGDVLEISGTVTIDKHISIEKNITLVGSAQKGTIQASDTLTKGTPYRTGVAAMLQVQTGKTLTLGNGTQAELLTLKEVHVHVTQGRLHMKDGVLLTSELLSPGSVSIVDIRGTNSHGTFEGGHIDNPVVDYGGDHNNTSVFLGDGASVDRISGGTYASWGSAWKVTGDGTSIAEISSGRFANSPKSGLSMPCFLLEKKATIGTISGGTFTAYSFGALQLESGAHVNEISGGIFINPYTTERKPSPSSGAKPFYAGLVLDEKNGNSPTTVEKITGGTFTGINGLLAVGDDPKHLVEIKEISGGTFSSLTSEDGNCGLYFTQNSQVDKLSGNLSATGKNCGIWNAGTIKEIAGGTYIGTHKDAIQNVDYSYLFESNPNKYWWTKHFKGKIETISGGTFKGGEHAIQNVGVIDTIAGGTFEGEKHAVLSSDKLKKGDITSITGGAFYAKSDTCIQIVKPLRLEEGLSASQPDAGNARFYAPEGKAIFSDEAEGAQKLVTYPTFTKDGAQKPYQMSKQDDVLNDVVGYETIGFRYLQKEAKPKPTPQPPTPPAPAPLPDIPQPPIDHPEGTNPSGSGDVSPDASVPSQTPTPHAHRTRRLRNKIVPQTSDIFGQADAVLGAAAVALGSLGMYVGRQRKNK